MRPVRGEVRAAVGLDDALTAAFLDKRGVRPETGWLRTVRTLIETVIHPRRRPTRHIAIIGQGATLPDVPRYVADVSAAAGVDLRGYRCGLAADGAYNTQKVLLYLLPPDGSTPTIVVKLTRDASVNARLETERDALRHLEAVGLAVDGRVPTVRFAGRHAGLAIVGEAAIEGRPYVQAMGPEPADGVIVDATAWLTELGAATTRMASASDVASALLDLHGRYLALCQPSPAEADRLRTELAAFYSIIGERGEMAKEIALVAGAQPDPATGTGSGAQTEIPFILSQAGDLDGALEALRATRGWDLQSWIMAIPTGRTAFYSGGLQEEFQASPEFQALVREVAAGKERLRRNFVSTVSSQPK